MIYWWGGRDQRISQLLKEVPEFLTALSKKPYALFHTCHQHVYTSWPTGRTTVKNGWFLNWDSPKLDQIRAHKRAYKLMKEVYTNNRLKHLCGLRWTYSVLDGLVEAKLVQTVHCLRTDRIGCFRKEFHQQTAAQRMFCGGFLNDCFYEQKPTHSNVSTSDARKILRTKQFWRNQNTTNQTWLNFSYI